MKASIIFCVVVLLGMFYIVGQNIYYHSDFHYENICYEKGLDYGWDCGIKTNMLNIFDRPKAMTFSELFALEVTR